MVTVLLWLCVICVVVAIVVRVRGLRRDKPATDQATYKALVNLYAIRQRLEVAQFRTELRRDAAYFRRELDKRDRL
jgi:hypothetical protein